MAPMSDSYAQLLDATIQHLELLKAQGVRFVPVAPEALAALNENPRPVIAKASAAPAAPAGPALKPEVPAPAPAKARP